MSTILLSLPEIFASYKNWVSQNPQHASDYETTAKWISYFIAGTINLTCLLKKIYISYFRKDKQFTRCF